MHKTWVKGEHDQKGKTTGEFPPPSLAGSIYSTEKNEKEWKERKKKKKEGENTGST